MLRALLLVATIADTDPVAASLRVDVAHIRPGRPFRAAVRMEMAPGWHTYWKNPGAAGASTRIVWRLPSGWSAGEILWPAPSRIPSGGLLSYGYETEVVFVSEIRPPARIVGDSVLLAADVNWVACEEICVAGRARATIARPVRDDEPPPSEFAGAIDAAVRRVPVSAGDVEARVEGPDRAIVSIPAPAGPIEVFPEGAYIVREIRKAGPTAGPRTEIVFEFEDGISDRIRAVVVPRGERALRIDVPIAPPRSASSVGIEISAAAILAAGIVLYLLVRRRSI